MFQRNEDTWKHYSEVQKADYTREDGITGYAWIARYTLHYLDAYLKHDTAAQDWIKKTPAENGAPAHFLSVSVRPAKGLPATLDSFRAELGRQGFDHAAEIYAAMKKENPEFKLDESAMNDWGDELMQESHLHEATALIELNIQIHPESSDAYTVLGEIYAKSGEKQLARENYTKALEKNSRNAEAKDKLQELGSPVLTSK
jgi:tetratricopeptide (TPR) repeat protein